MFIAVFGTKMRLRFQVSMIHHCSVLFAVLTYIVIVKCENGEDKAVQHRLESTLSLIWQDDLRLIRAHALLA